MRITVVSVGHRMPAWIQSGWGEYAKRLPPEMKLELTELKPEDKTSGKTVDKAKALEGERILAALPAGATVYALDEKGRAITTQGLSVMLAGWMRDGTATAVVDAVRAEAAARQALAREVLGKHAYAAHPNGHHIWVPLPPRWPAQRFAAHLHGKGLAVVTGDAFATDASPPNAIRIALGAARSRAQLTKALEILSDALGSQAPDQNVV